LESKSYPHLSLDKNCWSDKIVVETPR